MLKCSRSRRAGDDRLKSWRLTAMAEELTRNRGLITVFGGTGFLGRRIVRHLLDRGFPVRTASAPPRGGWIGIPTRCGAGDDES